MSAATLLPAAIQQDQQGLKRSTLPCYLLGMTGLTYSTTRVLGYHSKRRYLAAANRQEAWRSISSIHCRSKLLRRGSPADQRTAVPLHRAAPPEQIISYVRRDIGASSHAALTSGLESRSCKRTSPAPVSMSQPPSTVPSGMHRDAKRSLSRSASSASTFDPIRTTFHFCTSSKADAPNDDGDDLDDGMAI